MITEFEAILNLMPDAKITSCDGVITWHDPTQIPPTQAEIDAEMAKLDVAQAKAKCKEQASALLYETDWTQIPDCPVLNKQEFFNWRAIIRNYAINPVVDPVFPPKPNAEW